MIRARRLVALSSLIALQAGSLLAGDAPRFVGAETCRRCHEPAFRAWTGSHHQLAMQVARPATVLGNFDRSKFVYHGIESTFERNGDRFFVRTDGPDGTLREYEITHVFGVYPLQQYLIPMPGGRLQALSIAWDARPASEGGQRWYHLYPGERVDHRDSLHWTGPYQNWNQQCAACHSTDLRKNYDSVSASYRTTYSEINVACEACHGAGSTHVAWATAPRASGAPDGDMGLAGSLKSSWSEAWRFAAPDADIAQRTGRPPAAAVDTCAPCHSRRSLLKEGEAPGAPLQAAHRPSPLVAPQYHADGQQREEVYTWGSFVQSKMFARGVTCADCHEPHALTLRASGNALCTRCHRGATFDVPAHHRHRVGSAGARCVGCHMPSTSYMVIHARPDHSLRVPRPDLSLTLGTPNACTSCHKDKDARWAAERMDAWYGRGWRQRPTDGPAIAAGEKAPAAAIRELLELARNVTRPALARETAARLAVPGVRPTDRADVAALVVDPDPGVRGAAAQLAARFGPEDAVRMAGSLLDDSVRLVRIDAALALFDVPDSLLSAHQRKARQLALEEHAHALELAADVPSGQAELGNFRARQGKPQEARAAYERALALDARFVGAYVNLADLSRASGDEPGARAALERGLAAAPESADLHHALGLWLVRNGGDRAAAVAALAKACALDPDNARFAYVHAIALKSTGQTAEALEALKRAAARHPLDPDTLGALVSMSRDAGDLAGALEHARQLAKALPGHPSVARLVTELEAAQPGR